MKTFCSAKDPAERMKRLAADRCDHASDKGIVCRMYKELLKLNFQRQSSQKKGKDMKTHFPEEDIQVADKHIKTV